MDQDNQSKPSVMMAQDNRTRIILAVIVLVILIGLVLTAKYRDWFMPNTAKAPATATAQSVRISPLFVMQNARIEGKVTKIENNQMTITNTAGLMDTFPYSAQLVIYNYISDPNGAQSTSTSLDAIDKNKDASVSLVVVNGRYEIKSVTYIAR